jgi:hypothetical protein
MQWTNQIFTMDILERGFSFIYIKQRASVYGSKMDIEYLK